MEKIKKSWITLFVISVLMLITYWFEECWWSWKNCIGARLNLEDNIDRLMFFEELSSGFIQMRDEWIMSQPEFDPYNLSGRDPYYSYVMKKK
jgi:hypothetical protein